MTLQTFTIDPAATALEDAPKTIRNETGGALAAGDLLFIAGWSEAEGAFLVAKADADTPGAAARLVMRGSLADVTNGEAFRTFRLTGQDTSGSSVGDPVYIDITPGTFTLTTPTSTTAFSQIVGRVAVVNAVTGEIEFDLIEAAAIEVFGSNEFRDGAVTATKLDSTAARDNLSAMSDVDRRYVRTSPTSGEFKVIDVQRDAAGKLDIVYDDVVV